MDVCGGIVRHAHAQVDELGKLGVHGTHVKNLFLKVCVLYAMSKKPDIHVRRTERGACTSLLRTPTRPST